MKIGVPRETKTDEYRVALVPAGAEILVRDGHTVMVEAGAGEGSGITDADYTAVGVKIVPKATDVFGSADMILKVKEPQESEFALIRKGQILFTYFHFAASRPLVEGMQKSGSICIAYETVERENGSLPLLIPMSEVAGRMAVQEGAKYLERPMEGRGTLLAGVPGVSPASVVIIGGGIVGTNAARVAAGLGARVTILDINLDRLRYLSEIMPPNVVTIYSTPYTLRSLIQQADLVIGAVLIPGVRTPKLITREMLRTMKRRAVFIDVAIDQGGLSETSRPTTHSKPTYFEENVVHYCVTNIPGAVPTTSTYALTNATLPYAQEIARKGWRKAAAENPALRHGLGIVEGTLTHPGPAEVTAARWTPPEQLLNT